MYQSCPKLSAVRFFWLNKSSPKLPYSQVNRLDSTDSIRTHLSSLWKVVFFFEKNPRYIVVQPTAAHLLRSIKLSRKASPFTGRQFECVFDTIEKRRSKREFWQECQLTAAKIQSFFTKRKYVDFFHIDLFQEPK